MARGRQRTVTDVTPSNVIATQTPEVIEDDLSDLILPVTDTFEKVNTPEISEPEIIESSQEVSEEETPIFNAQSDTAVLYTENNTTILDNTQMYTTSLKTSVTMTNLIPIPHQHHNHFVITKVLENEASKGITPSVISEFVNNLIPEMKTLGLESKQEILNFVSRKFRERYTGVNYTISIGDGLSSYEHNVEVL